jgi:hypothetical protein
MKKGQDPTPRSTIFKKSTEPSSRDIFPQFRWKRKTSLWIRFPSTKTVENPSAFQQRAVEAESSAVPGILLFFHKTAPYGYCF